MQGCNPILMVAPGTIAPCGLPMILFDFDGTLVDSMELCVKEIEETYKAMDLPVPPRAVLEKCNGPTIEQAAEILGLPKHLHLDYVRIRNGLQMTLMASCQKIYPGIVNMLKALSTCAFMCIVSNGGQEYIDKSVDNWGIRHYFLKALGGRPGFTKAQVIAELLRELNPIRTVMVGDRLTDIQAGRENGLYTIAAAYGFGSPEEWREADRIADTVDELFNLCLQFCGR